MTQYVVDFSDPAGHLIDVTMTIERPLASQTVSMAAWIPGSYMIREFAKNIVTLSASQGNVGIAATKVEKATWRLICDPSKPLRIRYRVYAWDRSVRTNYFDHTRGFFNPAALCLRNDAAPGSPCELTVEAPVFEEGATWKVATAMALKPAVDTAERGSFARGFSTYVAADYDELIDHPFECAAFDEFTFEAGGVPHRFVISGRHRGDLERLRRDTQKICQAHIDLFGDATPPFDHYVFQLHVVDDGYGGLEHRASTALMSPRNNLPSAHEPAISEGYLELLGLISHEYFHAWNVKRIKPAAFTPYDTARENYTRLLWLFEGFTSYYDELMLLRAGLITEADYLKLISRHLTQLMRTPARMTHSIADSSFDAWIKYYRQDENTPNAIVSYYLKGGLIALLLDLKLRSQSDHSLDTVMRQLWRDYGSAGKGVPEDVISIFEAATGVQLQDFAARFIDGTVEPDWAEAFAEFGIVATTRVSVNASDRGGVASGTGERHARQLGLVLTEAGDVTVKTVLRDSAAHAAGLANGDILVAVDGLRATRNALAKAMPRWRVGEKIEFTYFRHDVLRTTFVEIPSPVVDTVSLAFAASPTPAQASRLKAWLTSAS